MVNLKNKRFPIGTYSKLKMRNFRPCKILRNFDSGYAYEVELLDDMDISPIFNITKYHESKDDFFASNDYPKKKIE